VAEAIGRRLEQVTQGVDLKQEDLAHVLNTSTRNVNRWISGERSPRANMQMRLREVLAVLELLSSVLTPTAAHDWLFSPNPLLGDERPDELLRRGQYRQVLGAVEVMAEGVFL
jgi:transcriptional regulator with XRE-family HTH domain